MNRGAAVLASRNKRKTGSLEKNHSARSGLIANRHCSFNVLGSSSPSRCARRRRPRCSSDLNTQLIEIL
jgi:hypothetical protein